MQNEKPIKYFLYARKSTESEDKQVQSIDSQITELRRIAETYNLNIVKTFQESKSAKIHDNRPEFNKMLKEIQAGKAQGILSWKIDRLSRNPVDSGMLQHLLQTGVIAHIKTFERDYNPTDNILMMSVELGMANQFLRDLSTNTKRGMRAKAEKGAFPGHPPIGYITEKYKPKGEKGVIPDPERFETIAQLWQILLEKKLPIEQIHDIAVKKLHLKGSTGNPVCRSLIYKMFTNPFYYGDFTWNKKRYRGNHKPMITPEQFEEAQKILNQKSRPTAIKEGHDLPFSGCLIRCGECNQLITGEKKIKKQKNGTIHEYIYYRCIKKKSILCSQKCIREEGLMEQIAYELRKIYIPKPFLDFALDAINKHSKEDTGLKNEALLKLHKEYNQESKRIENLKDMRVNGDLGQEEYQERITAVQLHKEALMRQIEGLDKHIGEQTDKALSELGFAHIAYERFIATKEDTVKREYLSRIGSLFFLKDRKLTLTLKPFFAEVLTAKESVEKTKFPLEPLASIDNQGLNAEMYASSPLVGAYRDLNPN